MSAPLRTVLALLALAVLALALVVGPGGGSLRLALDLPWAVGRPPQHLLAVSAALLSAAVLLAAVAAWPEEGDRP
jgi:hypothetical protein